MLTTLSFIQNVLPGGKIPNGRASYDLLDQPVTIPYAVIGWDDGLDSWEDDDGNVHTYQDSPPTDYIAGAFLTREEAEAYVAKYPEMRIEQDYVEPLWAFSSSLHWEGLETREQFFAMVMTEEEANEIVRVAEQAEQEAIAQEAKQDEYDNYYETLGA